MNMPLHHKESLKRYAEKESANIWNNELNFISPSNIFASQIFYKNEEDSIYTSHENLLANAR